MREADDELRYLLGNWLARWRAAVGASQRRVAAQAGIDQAGLSRIERGMQGCGSRRLARLVATLDDIAMQSPMRPIAPPPVRPRLVERDRDELGGSPVRDRPVQQNAAGRIPP
jgi:transcriptional regulator with XRE-family HTH domain